MKIHEAIIDKDKDGVYLQLPHDEKKRFTDDREFMNAYYAHEAINQLYSQNQQIQELEEENTKTKKWLDHYGFKTLEEFGECVEEECASGLSLVEENVYLWEKNAKLEKQLKNALHNIQNFIERKITASKKASQEYIDGYCACGCDINDYIEDEIKAEARKYLEEHK